MDSGDQLSRVTLMVAGVVAIMLRFLSADCGRRHIGD
jgi:hypothetical protein